MCPKTSECQDDIFADKGVQKIVATRKLHRPEDLSNNNIYQRFTRRYLRTHEYNPQVFRQPLPDLARRKYTLRIGGWIVLQANRHLPETGVIPVQGIHKLADLKNMPRALHLATLDRKRG